MIALNRPPIMPGQSQEGFRSLEHVTDAFIESWSTTFEGAMAQAGLGFLDTMIEVASVRETFAEEIEVSGHDELELVYNWLEELLLAFELRRKVFARFDVAPIRPSSGLLHFRTRANGELYDATRHGGKVEVKGVTYHMMKVIRENGLVRIQYVLDL